MVEILVLLTISKNRSSSVLVTANARPGKGIFYRCRVYHQSVTNEEPQLLCFDFMIQVNLLNP